MIHVAPLQYNESQKVAALHLEHLRTPFLGRAGQKLLTCNYRTMALQCGTCCYVAKNDGRTVGFVCGVWEPVAFRRVLIHDQGLTMGYWGLRQVLRRPYLLYVFLNKFIISARDPSAQIVDIGYELRPIVVIPEARGSGVAQRLLETLLEDASRRGFADIFLYTEEDNLAAQRFYQKSDFVERGKLLRNGIVYLRFERDVRLTL